MSTDLREELADYAHEAWSHWMKYLWNKCDDIDAEGTIRIPNWAVARWDRQMTTPYAELPENEKDSDRAEADRMLAIMQATGHGFGVFARSTVEEVSEDEGIFVNSVRFEGNTIV